MQIYIYAHDQQLGPFDLSGLQDGIRQSHFTIDDLAWEEGQADWRPLKELVNSADLCASLPEASPEQSDPVDPAIARLISDDQDPALVYKVVAQAQELLTNGELIEYIGVQRKPIVTLSPDAILLTNRRFMIIRFRLMGMTFEDFPWREVVDVHMSEQLLGATITCTTSDGRRTAIESIPKKQARRIYTHAQEVEERAHFQRRDAELERLRAAAGGIVVQNPSISAPPPRDAAPQKDDPAVVLSTLKKLLDGGLIEQSEYDAKKAEILSRM